MTYTTPVISSIVVFFGLVLPSEAAFAHRLPMETNPYDSYSHEHEHGHLLDILHNETIQSSYPF